MRNWLIVLMALGAVVVASPARAQSVRSEVTASNGVAVTVYADDFADRYEYSSPVINFPNLGGFMMVSRVKRAGTMTPVEVVGAIMYNGEWRFYTTALYRGGVAADYTREGGSVNTCAGSRYRGCSLTEQFRLNFTAQDVAQHAENGVLPVQVRAQQGDPVMLEIPIAHIEAVTEVSAR
jgi:hypothetical protein